MTTQPPPESAEPAPVCTYEIYPGKCGQPASDGDRCPEHAPLVCIKCGKRAVIACDYEGQFVCGYPLCAGCVHDEKTGGHKAKSPAPVDPVTAFLQNGPCPVPAPVATDTQVDVMSLPRREPRPVVIVGGSAATPPPADPQARECNCGEPDHRHTHWCSVHATPAPAGDAEVSHEQARSIIREAWDAPVSLKDCLLKLRRYIDQREADDRAARRDLEDMRERRRVERVRASDAEIALTEERSRSAGLSRKLEAAERLSLDRRGLLQQVDAILSDAGFGSKPIPESLRELVAAKSVSFIDGKGSINEVSPDQAPPATETEDPTCSGEWLSGSGGHRQFGGCGRAAVWVEHGTGAAFCDEHGPTFRATPPPAKPLTRDDVKAIARAVIAEVAERANGQDDWDELALLKLAKAAKEESGGG